MMTLGIVMRQERPPEMMQRAFNDVVRASLIHAAQYWIQNFLPLHFTPGAAQRYGYLPRSARYQAIKETAQKVRVPFTGFYVAAPKPPMDLVWSGQLRAEVLGRGLGGFNIRATATSNKQRVVVPIRLPHPMPARHAWNLTALTPAERGALHEVAIEKFRQLLPLFSAGTKVEHIAA